MVDHRRVTIERGAGDLLAAEVDALVNTVNTECVMGKGLALQIKTAFPDVFAEYARACKRGSVSIGTMHVVHRSTSPRFVINFPSEKLNEVVENSTWRHADRPDRYERMARSGAGTCLMMQAIVRNGAAKNATRERIDARAALQSVGRQVEPYADDAPRPMSFEER